MSVTIRQRSTICSRADKRSITHSLKLQRAENADGGYDSSVSVGEAYFLLVSFLADAAVFISLRSVATDSCSFAAVAFIAEPDFL